MLDISRDIQSLSTFKRETTNAISQMKRTGEPIVLTVNGKAEVVVQDARSYQKLLEKIEKLEVIAGIKQGLAEVESGKTRPANEFSQEMQKKYGISS